MGPSSCFTHVMIYWTVWDRFIQVLYLGRAPRTKETLSDFLKWRRVTRHPLIFRGLTGSQRTPRNWGVTSTVGLGGNVNLLPYSVYKQLGFGELKHTNITLSLADRSVNIPKGIVEDVLVKVDKFYYPLDFVVLDTEPIAVGPIHLPIILGRTYLATSNAIINFRNGVMQLTFGNMTLELNIFHLSNKHKLAEDEGQELDDVFLIGPGAGKPNAHKLLEELVKKSEAVDGILIASVTPIEPMIPPAPPSEKKLNTKELSMKATAAHLTAGVKELFLLDPP